MRARPVLAPAEAVRRHDHDGGVARQHSHPLADQPVDLGVVIRDGRPELAVALFADPFAIRRMKRREEVIDGVGAFVRNHHQHRILPVLPLVVVEIDGHAMVVPGLGQDAAEDHDRIGGIVGVDGGVPFVRRDVQEAPHLRIADRFRRNGQRGDAIGQRRRDRRRSPTGRPACRRRCCSARWAATTSTSRRRGPAARRRRRCPRRAGTRRV